MSGSVSQIDYAVRRSTRARRVRVTVALEGTVEVVLPARAPARAAAHAVRELTPWIERQRSRAAATRATVAARGASLPYLGATLRLVPEPGRSRVHRRNDALLVPAADPGAALERFYRRSARAEVLPRLEAACAVLGRPHAGLTIRGQRTRWASCAASGAMSFNWRLLLAPAAVLDYVVWHEACHLVHRDHSPAFWALVAHHFPGWREQRDWLRRHGATLVL